MIRLLGLGLAAFVIAADQLTKSRIRGLFAGLPMDEQVRTFTNFFRLVLTWNRGMSFGFFNGDSSANTLVFSLLAAVIVAFLLIWLWRSRDWLVVAGLGLAVGGAIGNVIDRLRFGAVVDFLDFHWHDIHFWAFNLADSAITTGVVLLLIDGLLVRRESPK